MVVEVDFDVETTGIQYYSDELFIVTLDDGEHRDVYLHPQQKGAILDRIKKLLKLGAEWHAWNSKFDLHFLEVNDYPLPPEELWHDDMVMAHVVDERRRSFALKKVGESLFGPATRDPEKALKEWLTAEQKRRRDISKLARKTAIEEWVSAHLEEYGGKKRETRKAAKEIPDAVFDVVPYDPPTYRDVPWEIMEPYAAEDVILTRKIRRIVRPHIERIPDLKAVYEMERGTLAALYAAERIGLPIDKPAAARLELASAEKLDHLQATARDLAGKSDFNPNSPVQVAEALKRRGVDLTYVEKTKTGQYSMNEESLMAMDDELAGAVLRFRGESKMLSTYVTPLLHDHWDGKLGIMLSPYIAPDGRIHTNMRQVGARTGRMSSAGPNIQNFPRDDLRLRYLIQADPGYKIVAADLSSIEMVLLAAYVGEGTILEYVRAGRTKALHQMTADALGLMGRQRATGFESPRQQGKRMNYLQIYGGGVRAIRKWFFVPQARAHEMIDTYHTLYPEVKALSRVIEYNLRDKGYIKTPWGRRHRVENVDKESYKFLNYLIQGAAADLMKASVVRLHREGWPIVAVVHDEVVLHVPEDRAEEAAAAAYAALTEHPQLKGIVPLDAEADIVDRWSQAKDPDFIPEHEKEEIVASTR